MSAFKTAKRFRHGYGGRKTAKNNNYGCNYLYIVNFRWYFCIKSYIEQSKMTQQETNTIFRVFISCPSDVSPEKQALETEIQKYNNTVYKNQSIRIDALTWDKSIYPKSGVEAQELINETINEYDIYIGIMAGRFGAPTKRALSGTGEEYDDAITKYKKNPDGLHVAFFFKNVDLQSNATDDECDQYIKVRNFKKKAYTEGLCKEFDSPTDFVNIAMSLIADFVNKETKKVLPNQGNQLLLLADIPNETSFKIDNEFLNNFLNSTGVDITNGHVANINLEDIYVPLDLRVMDSAKKQRTNLKVEEAINSNEVISNISSPFKLVITGDEKSGKTSFAKNLYMKLHQKGFIPVLLNGGDIKNVTIDNITKKINSNVSEQYSSDSLSSFLKQPKDKVVLIIDDYQRSKPNIKHKTRLLKLIGTIYPNVVCLADSVFEIDATTSIESEYRELTEYRKYRLKEAGHKVRFSIIEKWNSLGKEELINREELDIHNLKAQQIIDQVVCTNFVPCTPFFVLVFLQAIEAGSAEKLSERSFVRYYQFLIDSHLLKKIPDSDAVELYYALLPEIAYAIFNKDGSNSLTFDELSNVINDYASSKGISKKDIDSVRHGLTKHSILENNSDECSFRQPYAYYYFLSAYLHNNFSNKKVKEKVKELCRSLYVRQNSDIIIFLSYHTNDTFILDEITVLSNSLFTNQEPFNYDKDKNTPINQLVSEGPKLVIDHENSRAIHKKGLASRDNIEESFIEDEKTLADCQDINELDFSAKLNLTFKVSQILGQLLKNHHVQLDKKHKEAICLTVYNLMLRCLNVIISNFASNIDELIEELKEFDSNIDSEKDAQKALFNFISFITYGFIKNAASFVGAEKLEEIYKGTEKETDSLAVQVINTSIKLDYFKDLPFSDLKKTRADVSGNLLAETCLKLLAGHRMYVRPIEDHAKRQQICDLVGIDHKKQLIQSAKNKVS